MKCTINKKYYNILLVQVFAALHAIVSMVCGVVDIADDLMLTLLTMFMVVVICLRQQAGAVFMTVMVVMANLVGFVIGKSLPLIFDLVQIPSSIIHPISTLLCTELLGCLTIHISGIYKHRFSRVKPPSPKGLHLVLTVFVLIVFLRLMLILFSPTLPVPASVHNFRLEIMLNYFFSCIALMGVAEYAIHSREKERSAAEEASKASFMYMKLKQQVNPHFLFNTLNVLDYLIQDKPREEASRYTHKLAEIYRYMIKNESEVTVRLRDELEFVDKYIALMKVRFDQGLELKLDVPDEALLRSVVPCSVQLLIENATKHNSISSDKPLIITIKATQDKVIVTNNIQRRISRVDSTGFGIRYLKEQYKRETDTAIIVSDDQNTFTVTLPLL